MLAGNKLIRSRAVGAASAAAQQRRPSQKRFAVHRLHFFSQERILLFKKFLALDVVTFSSFPIHLACVLFFLLTSFDFFSFLDFLIFLLF